MENEDSKNLIQKCFAKFLFEAVLLLLVGILGIIGNISSIVIFSRIKKQLKFHRLMMMLAVYDTFCILFSILIFTIPLISSNFMTSGLYHYIIPKALPLVQIAMTGSVYSTIAISVERYLIVCHPFYVVSHEWSFKKYVVPIVTFSFVYNIPRFFELKTEIVNITTDTFLAENTTNHNRTTTVFVEDNTKEENCTFDYPTTVTESFANLSSYNDNDKHNNSLLSQQQMYKYNVVPTDMRTNTYYYSIYYIWTNFLVMGSGPFLILVILNLRTLKGLMSSVRLSVPQVRARTLSIVEGDSTACVNRLRNADDGNADNGTRQIKTSEVRLAKVSLMIVFVFIICHSARWIPNIYELYSRVISDDLIWSPWVESVTNVSNFLVVLNSSVNFFIYCVTHYRLISDQFNDDGHNTQFNSTIASEGRRRRRNSTEHHSENTFEHVNLLLSNEKQT